MVDSQPQGATKNRGVLGNLVYLFLTMIISEDFWVLLHFPHLSEGTKALRSLRKERKKQKSALLIKEKVNNKLLAQFCANFGEQLFESYWQR